MSDKIKDFIGGSVGYLAAALVAIAYITAGLLVPGVTGKPVLSIVADGAVGFLLGVALNFCLNLQGVLKGKRSEKMEQTVRAHGEAVIAIEPYIHRLDEWCIEQNAAALRRERSRILTCAAMRYSDYFDEQGMPLDADFSGIDKIGAERRRDALDRAIKLQLTPLSAASLTGDGEKPGDPYYLGETVDQYQRRTNIWDTVSKLFIALGFGYFSVDMVLGFDGAELIWRALYVALLFALGVVKLLRSYLFITDTYRGNIIKRINYLQSFKNWAEKTPEKEEEHVNDKREDVHAG